MRSILAGVCAVILIAGAALLSSSRDLSEEYMPPLGTVVGDRTAEQSASGEPVSLIFVGDMMFDRLIRTRAHEHGYRHVVADMAPLLREADIVVGNLEGPITNKSSVSEGTVPGDVGNMTFTFPPQVAALLRESGFSVVSIGNNHTLDFGPEGLAETRTYLESAGLAYIGDPDAPFAGYVVPTGHGVLRLYGYNQFGGTDATSLAEHIAQYSADDFTVIYTHWGDEYVSEPPIYVRKTARQFVDAGADLVIGTHPHVIQSVEEYRGARIYYSLGNFIFDQYWNDAVRTGMLVHVTLTENRVLYSEKTVRLERDGRTIPVQ